MKIKHIVRQKIRIDGGNSKTPIDERQYERGYSVNMGNVSYFVKGNVSQWWMRTFYTLAKLEEGSVDADMLMSVSEKCNEIRGKI